MSSLHDLEKQLESLTRGEKAQLLQWVARDIGDAFPGIESTRESAAGEPCIVRTRIPVWVLGQARRQGISEAELLRSYPTLRAEDLANAWGYILRPPRGDRPADPRERGGVARGQAVLQRELSAARGRGTPPPGP